MSTDRPTSPPTPRRGGGLAPSWVIVDDPIELPPTVHVTRRSHLAQVERAREALLTAERPLVALRWLIATTPPEVLAEACADQRVRERLREPFAQVAEWFRQLGEALAPAVEAMREALTNLGRAAVEAGLSPERPPTEPRARALWLRQHRSTGPSRPGPEQRRPPRRHR